MRTPLIAFVLFSALLAGCATTKPERARHNEPTTARAGGYLGESFAVAPIQRESWLLGTDEVDVSMTFPEGSGRFPIILYFPGLGEPAEAGGEWRRAWAQGGYAIFAVQPVRFGPTAWQGSQARAGDFLGVAREAVSAKRLNERLDIVRRAYAELNHRIAQGKYGQADPTRLAVAGFDLGAQTSMAIAGQSADGTGEKPWPEPVKAVIALSPYADFSAASAPASFASITTPVLSITSLEDVDSYGLVTSAAVRRAPFQYMPTGNKYLLVLAGANHSTLSGGAGQFTPDAQPNAREEQGNNIERPGESRGNRRGDGNGKRRSAGGQAGGYGGTQRSAPPGVDLNAMRGAHSQIIAGFTTAYLDAIVKNDPVAWEWLTRDARRWLGDSAQLSVK